MKINQEYCKKLYRKALAKNFDRELKIVPKITNKYYKFLLKEIKKAAKNGNSFLIIDNDNRHVDYNILLGKLRKLNFEAHNCYSGYCIEWGDNKNE